MTDVVSFSPETSDFQRVTFPHPAAAMPLQNFKQHFVEECRNIDIHRDTFAGLLIKTGGRMSTPPPKLSRRDWNLLHGIYLNSLSEALRANSSSRKLALGA